MSRGEQPEQSRARLRRGGPFSFSANISWPNRIRSVLDFRARYCAPESMTVMPREPGNKAIIDDGIQPSMQKEPRSNMGISPHAVKAKRDSHIKAIRSSRLGGIVCA
jgi:hypothetical protein